MVSKITVSILALISWDLVEWTGNEGKLLKLGELWAIKHSVLRRPLPLMREKSDAIFLWSSLWEGKGDKASFRLLWRVERCQKDLRWLRYDQSEPRLTSTGIAMTKVVPERPPLASLWPKWSQKDLVWLRYDQSGPRKTSAGFAMATVSLERVQLDLVPTPLKWNQRYRDGDYLLVASVLLFPTFLPKACLSGKIALASGRLALLSACVSACSSWWAEQMECHDAVVCVSIRLIEQVLRSLWWVVEDEKRVSISPTLWERFSLLFW